MQQYSDSTLTEILTLQLVVAWAGESETDPPRLKWWKSALSDPYGGVDLMTRMAPRTGAWAVLQALREVALRTEAAIRSEQAMLDSFVTLYHLGFDLDEQVAELLIRMKRAGARPEDQLPGYFKASASPAPAAIEEWFSAHGPVQYRVEPVGRRIPGAPPSSPEKTARLLVGALAPLHVKYPLPYFMRE